LDFGFWIADFGFWIADFGFWIADFGFWIADFGFWIAKRLPEPGFRNRSAKSSIGITSPK
jgi:hypothetical protein